MANPKHAHKLKRHSYRNGEKIFFCTLDDCSFKINVKLAIGKTAECNRCGNPFQLNEYSIRLARPHCNDCTKETEGKAKISISIHVPSVSSLKDRLHKVSKSTDELEEDML